MKKLERAAGMFCTKPSRVVVRVMGYPFFFSVIYYIRIFILVLGCANSSEREAGAVRRLRGQGVVVMNSVTFGEGNCKVEKA